MSASTTAQFSLTIYNYTPTLMDIYDSIPSYNEHRAR